MSKDGRIFNKTARKVKTINFSKPRNKIGGGCL
jgi:hypothetical protein